MSRTTRLLTLLLTALLLPAASAGTAADPELTDPAGDTAQDTRCEPPSCLSSVYTPNAAASDMVDILAAWFTEDDDAFTVTVQTATPTDDATQVTVGFDVAAGPNSTFGSTADGARHEATALGTTLQAGAPNGTTVARAGNLLNFTITRTAVGAVGGDVLANLTVDTTRTESSTDTFGQGTQVDTDGAPNAGVTARDLTLARPPVVAAATFQVVAAVVSETIPRELADGNTTLSDPAARNDTVTRSVAFTTNTVETYDGNATVTFTLRLTNTGTDTDTFNVTVFQPSVDTVGSGTDVSGLNLTRIYDATAVTLDPGAATNVTLVVALQDAGPMAYATVLQATSSRNVTYAAAAGAVVTVQPIFVGAPDPDPGPDPDPDPGPEPTPTTEREVYGGLTALTPAAEALRFDDAFGQYAELVLLALLILLLLVVLFLLLALVRGGWVAVRITPKTLTAGPGETAEFNVEVRNRKRRFRGAMAHFEGDEGWKTGVLLRSDDGTAVEPIMEPGVEREVGLAARKESGDTLEGTLRVQVPDDTVHGERGTVRLHVVPVGDDGRQRPRHAGHAKVRVTSDAHEEAGVVHTPSSGGVPLRMSGVQHDPPHPDAGEVVTTTATLQNDSASETLRLRVVLQLDGEDADEEIVAVPPHSARAVEFRWMADEGSNRVRVQVFQADE